ASTPRWSRSGTGTGGGSPCAPRTPRPSWPRRPRPTGAGPPGGFAASPRAGGRSGGFHEVSYREDQPYAGHQGAVVFEYEAVVDGRRVHVSHINFKGRTWGYNV